MTGIGVFGPAVNPAAERMTGTSASAAWIAVAAPGGSPTSGNTAFAMAVTAVSICVAWLAVGATEPSDAATVWIAPSACVTVADTAAPMPGMAEVIVGQIAARPPSISATSDAAVCTVVVPVVAQPANAVSAVAVKKDRLSMIYRLCGTPT